MKIEKFWGRILLLSVWMMTLLACRVAVPFIATPTPIASPSGTATPLPPTATATLTPRPTATVPVPALNPLTTSSCGTIGVLARIGKGQITQSLYSSDGAFLLVASAGGLELYDAKEWKIVWGNVTKTEMRQVAMDLESQQIIAVDSDNSLHLFELKTGKLLNSAKQDEGKYMATALAADGKIIAATGFDGVVYQYDTENFDKKGAAINGPATLPEAMFGDMVYLLMTYSPNGKYLAIATLRAEVDIYDTSTGKLVKKIDPLDPDYEKRIFPEHLVFSPDEKKIAIDYMNGQTLITSVTGNQPGKLVEGKLPSISPDGETVALKTSKGIELFQASTGKALGELPDIGQSLGNSVFSPDGQTLVTFAPGGTHIWDVKTRKTTQTVSSIYSDYQVFALSENGKVLASGSQQRLDIFYLKTGENIPFVVEHAVEVLKFAANDTKLIVAGSSWVSVFDLEQEKVLQSIELSKNVLGLDVSRDGQMMVVVTADHTVTRHDLSKNTQETISEADQGMISVGFVDETTILGLGDKDQVYISTAQTPKFERVVHLPAELSKAPNSVFPLTVRSGEPGTVRVAVYDLAKEELLYPLEYREKPYAVLTINGLASTSSFSDDTLSLFDVYSSTDKCDVKEFKISIKQMLFSADGQYFFVLGNNGIIHMFGTKTDDAPQPQG